MSGSPRLTVQVRDSGVGSCVPLTLTAATVSVCGPSATAGSVYSAAQVNGAPPSSVHSNVEPAWSARKTNVGVASESVEFWAGPETIVVEGAGSTARP